MALKENTTTYNKIYDKTPAIITIKDKKTFEKWLQAFQPWIETGGATDVALATYNLTNKDLGRLFVLRFCKHSAEFIMTIPILGYGSEDQQDTTGMHAAEQTLAKQIQTAAKELGHEEKFENLLLSSTNSKKGALSQPAPPASVKKEQTEEEKQVVISQQLREAAKAEAAKSSSREPTSARKTNLASQSVSPGKPPGPTTPLISPPQEHEISDDLLQFMGINMTEKKKLATAPPIWMNVVTWARERPDFMAARVAIWNYVAKCLHESPYAHILNQTEVYDVRGLYAKLKEILHKSSIIGLSSLTADFFQTMLNPGTKDPVCYFNELTEKADVIAEMAQQVDRDAREDLTGGFKIPKFLITVALIHTLTMRKEFNNFMRRLLEEGNLNRVQLSPEKLIEEAQRYQENLRLINPRMGANIQRMDTSDTLEAQRAEESKGPGKKKDACHRNHNGKYCDETKCKFKHYKPSVEKPPSYTPDYDFCLGCGKEKSKCPSREACTAKDSTCDNCKKKGHLTECCLKKLQAQGPQKDTSTVTSGGRGRGRGGRRGGGRGGSKSNQAVHFEKEAQDEDTQVSEYDSEEESYSLFHAQALYGKPSSVSRPKSASSGKRIGEASHPGPPAKTISKCQQCGLNATTKCAPCGIPYCSKACQALNRKAHREDCQRLSLMRECVRCGLRTGGWCDNCENTFTEFKRGLPNNTACGRALCRSCEDSFGFCNACLPSGEPRKNQQQPPLPPSGESSLPASEKTKTPSFFSNSMMGSMSQSSKLIDPSHLEVKQESTDREIKSASEYPSASTPANKTIPATNAEPVPQEPSVVSDQILPQSIISSSSDSSKTSTKQPPSVTESRRVHLHPCSLPYCAAYGKYRCSDCGDRYCSKECQIKDRKDHHLRCAKLADLLPAIPDSDEQNTEGFSPFNPVAPDPGSAHPSLQIAQSLLKMQNPFRPYCINLVKALEIVSPVTDPVVNHLPKMHALGRYINPQNPWSIPNGYPEEELFRARIFFDTISKFNLFLIVEIYLPWGSDVFGAFFQIGEQFQEAEEGHLQAAMFNFLTSQEMLEMVSQPVKLASLNARFSKDSGKLCFWPYNGAVCWRSFLDFHSKEIDRIAMEEVDTIPIQRHSGTSFLQYLCRDFPFLVELLQSITRVDLVAEGYRVSNILIAKMALHSSVEAQYSLIPEPFLRLLHLELIIWGRANSRSLKSLFALHDNYYAAVRSTSAVADKLYCNTSVITRIVSPDRPEPNTKQTLGTIQDASSCGTQKRTPSIMERLSSLSDYLKDITLDPDLELAMAAPRPPDGVEKIYELLEDFEDKVVGLNRYIFGYERQSQNGSVPHNSTEAEAKSLEEDDDKPLTFQFNRQRRPDLDDSQIPPIPSGYHCYQPDLKQDPERS